MNTLPDFCSPVPLDKAYRLLNHGPTVLVSSAHAGEHNVMAAAWSMPLDFQPPKVTVVIDKATRTRTLVEGSGWFALNIPARALAQGTARTTQPTDLRPVYRRSDPRLGGQPCVHQWALEIRPSTG
jgi:flavin reductase (DIM6/NTAB) family NADH-FMN oxidoreductase RutF